MITSLVTLYLTAKVNLPANNKPIILYVGDSHSYGELGKEVEKELQTTSSDVRMYAACGASASSWLTGAKTTCGYWQSNKAIESRKVISYYPALATLLTTTKPPDIVIAQLGTNMAYNPKKTIISADLLMNTIKQKQAICVWIGPPNTDSVLKNKVKELDRLLNITAKENRCYYISSLPFTNAKDTWDIARIHFTPQASKEWGKNVGKEILNYLQHY